MDVFARGMIWGMHVAKAPREDICKEVVKKDGRPPSIQAVDQVIAHMTATTTIKLRARRGESEWRRRRRGVRVRGRGRDRRRG